MREQRQHRGAMTSKEKTRRGKGRKIEVCKKRRVIRKVRVGWVKEVNKRKIGE